MSENERFDFPKMARAMATSIVAIAIPVGILYVLYIFAIYIAHLDQPNGDQIKYSKDNPDSLYGDDITKVNIIKNLCFLKKNSEDISKYENDCSMAGQIDECIKIKSGRDASGMRALSEEYQIIPEVIRPNAYQCFMGRK